jgi:hypothetical protein
MKAYYNPATDTIHNCAYGSRTYWHEYRHQQQWKSPVWDMFRTVASYSSLIASIISIVAALYYLVGGITYMSLWISTAAFLSFQFLYIFAEEIDAHIYSVIKYRKEQQK